VIYISYLDVLFHTPNSGKFAARK